MQNLLPRSLRRAEQRVYSACWQDGSVDLFAGVGLACAGIAWISDLVALGPIAPAMAVPLWAVFRQRVVEPRIGQVRFDPVRRGRMRRAHGALLAAGCAALMLVLALVCARTRASADGEEMDLARRLVPALPGALVAFAIVLASFLFSIPRFALYSVPFLAGGFVVMIVDGDPGWGLFAGGAVMALVGGVLMARFFAEFPVLSNELE